MYNFPEIVKTDPKSMTYRDVNKKLEALKDSFIWDLKPGSGLVVVQENIPIPCSETINGVTYTTKIGTERRGIIYHGFTYNGKKLTFGEMFSICGLQSKKYIKKNRWDFNLKKGQYINKVHQYLSTAFAINLGYDCYWNRYVWLEQIKKDRVYFNVSPVPSGPFFNVYLELPKNEDN